MITKKSGMLPVLMQDIYLESKKLQVQFQSNQASLRSREINNCV